MMEMTNQRAIRRRYKKWFLQQFTGLRDKIRDYSEQFNTARDSAVLERQKELHPRKKKNFPILPEADFDAICTRLRAQIMPEAGPVYAALEDSKKSRSRILNQLAPQIVPEADPTAWHRVRACATSTYSTQTQPHFYAKNSLLQYQAALESKGLATHIRYVHRWRTAGGRGPFGYSGPREGGDYELWANCPDWMADAVIRQITVDEALTALPSTCNAKVLMPFLDYTRFEKHMMGGYKQCGLSSDAKKTSGC